MTRKNVFKIFIGIFLIICVVTLILNPQIIRQLAHVKKIKQYILGFGMAAPIVFILTYTFRTLFFVFPVSIFAIASGAIFGLYFGFIYSMIGAFLSASTAFFIGRYLAKDLVVKYLSGKIKKLHGLDQKGFKIVLYLRLIMIMPYDAFSYIVGATKIKYKDFILGTMIGIIPEFCAYTYLGYLGGRAHISLMQKIGYACIFIIVFLTIHFVNKYLFKNKKEDI